MHDHRDYHRLDRDCCTGVAAGLQGGDAEKGGASDTLCAPVARGGGPIVDQPFFAFIMRSMIGARTISIANPILPPGTTSELRRDMNEESIMLSR